MAELDPEERAVLSATLGAMRRAPSVTVGYRTLSADEAREILRRPHVAEAVAEGVRAALALEGAPQAAALLVDTVGDDTAPLKHRLEAANSVLDRAGYPRQSSIAAELGSKAPSEMTAAELEHAAALAARRLADANAIVVDSVPIRDAIPDNAKDLFE